jgi:DAK2 domain fusion protein YloV
VLREAGVVDAGGQGLYTILQGILKYAKGEAMDQEIPEIVSSGIVGGEISSIQPTEELFGFCTEFLISGEHLDVESLKNDLNGMGQSLVVVGSDRRVRVHIHTEHPGAVIHHASTFGEAEHVSVRNMEEQHRAYTAMRNHTIHNHDAPVSDVSVIAVTLGDGLAEVFASLGAMAVIAGGQTMNPSTGELAEAVDSVPSGKVILLPNNKNVVITANQVQAVTSKEIAVVPTENIPQGVAALIAYHADSDFQRNVEAMSEAIQGIQTIEIIRSIRNAKFGGFEIRRGQAMGFLEGELVVVDDMPDRGLKRVLADMDLTSYELVTLYRGADVEEAAAQSLTRELETQYPHLQFELIYGGQPFSSYIVSVE